MSADSGAPSRADSRDGLYVDFPRLQADVEALARIGRRDDFGLYRQAFTPAFMEACSWLQGRAEEAALHVELDGAMNVHVTEAVPHKRGPTVMTGSHLDTVPGGGHLDGALGVVVGLECLRRIKELGLNTDYPLELVAFADEEGRFGGMFGSQAVAGRLTPEFISKAADLDGVSLSEAMEACGGHALYALRAARPPDTIRAFVELHIEQGPVLDAAQLHVGAVEGIVGLIRWNARFLGQANHAGTTPLHMRKDALLGLSELALALPQIARENGTQHAVATIGFVQMHPGSANVIPGSADFSVDMRDLTDESVAALAEAVRIAGQRIARARAGPHV